MKLLKRDMVTFEYRAYQGKQEVLTEDGRHTGHTEVVYADPVQYAGNVSLPYGYASQWMFGRDANYTHVLLMDDVNADIAENGLIDFGDNTYEIRSVRKSPNYLAVALKKRTKTETVL